jgi:predicted DNA-binding transcriptional regulator AlpA
LSSDESDAELVDFPRVELLTGGLSRATINRRIKDGSFPRPVVLSRDRHGRPRVAFVLVEVLAYNRRAIATGRGSGGLRSA